MLQVALKLAAGDGRGMESTSSQFTLAIMTERNSTAPARTPADCQFAMNACQYNDQRKELTFQKDSVKDKQPMAPVNSQKIHHPRFHVLFYQPDQ
jgi:hypothetical protein